MAGRSGPLARQVPLRSLNLGLLDRGVNRHRYDFSLQA